MATTSIGRHPTTNVMHAFDYAKKVGRPLNWYVVICCDEEGANKTASAICRDVRDRFRAWLLNAAKRYGCEKCPPTYVQSIEDPTGTHPHANWVVHVPPMLSDEFLKKLPQWLRKAQGGLRPLDICAQQVDPETDKTLAKYVMKGANEMYVEYFYLEKFASPQGIVWGRRTCVSPSIGRTARREAGFIPKYHRDEWKRYYVAPTRKPEKKVFVNTDQGAALTAQKKVRKTAWGGVELETPIPSVQRIQPGHLPLRGRSTRGGVGALGLGQ